MLLQRQVPHIHGWVWAEEERVSHWKLKFNWIPFIFSAQFPKHIRLLALFSALVNDVVGDGIADLLAVECLLRHFGWSIQQWEQQTYANMPNVQLKVTVRYFKNNFIFFQFRSRTDQSLQRRMVTRPNWCAPKECRPKLTPLWGRIRTHGHSSGFLNLIRFI